MKSYDVWDLFQNKLLSGKGSGEGTEETKLPIYCNSCNTMVDTMWLVIILTTLAGIVKIKNQKPTASILLNKEI